METEYRNFTIALNAFKQGQVISGSAVLEFDDRVLKVGVAVRGFRLTFTNGEHPFHEATVRNLSATILAPDFDRYLWASRVAVRVELGLRDNSGTYDDAFQGEVDCVAIAEKGFMIAGENMFSLRAMANGKLVHVSWSAPYGVIANAGSVGPQEQLVPVSLDAGDGEPIKDGCRVALRTNAGQNSKYLRLTADGTIKADTSELGPAAIFTVQGARPGDGWMERIGLRASNGMYVCADGAGASPLAANRFWLRQWETFSVVPPGNPL